MNHVRNPEPGRPDPMTSQGIIVRDARIGTWPDGTPDQRWSRAGQEIEFPGSTATQPWGEHGGEHGDPPPGFDPFLFALETRPAAFDPAVRYRRSNAELRHRDAGPGWLVLVNGRRVGEVQSRRIGFPRYSDNGRIIVGTSYFTRWVIIGPLVAVSGVTWDTRRQAAASVIEKIIGVDFATSRRWVGTSRVERLRETPVDPDAQADTARAHPAYADWLTRTENP